MPVEQVTRWAFAGKHYPTELDAIEAALGEIAKRIIKDHATNPPSGMMAYRDDLACLLLRHMELRPNVEAESKDAGRTCETDAERTREGQPQ